MRGVSVAITFVILDLLLVTVASLIARHPRVMTTGQRWAPRITPPLYLLLAVVIMWQCNWLSFLN
jgi:cadmium resistance protein CadD (predicted permease)